MRTAAVQCRRSSLISPAPSFSFPTRHLSSTGWPRSNDRMDVSTHMAVAELDLSASCGPNTIVDRINAMPALKTSTAFFTFLRANLVLPHSALSSNVSTPYLEPHTSQTLPPLSPSPLAANPPLSILDDDIPPLSLDILTTPTDKADALALITDSIVQQRDQTALALATHPLVLVTVSAALFTIHQYAYIPNAPSFRLALLLVAALLAALLFAIHRLSSGYLDAASSFRLPPNTDHLILGTRLGNVLVGALVLHLEPTVSSPGGGRKKQHHRSASLRGGKGVIRAWTTRRGYRGQGFGAELLREAARLTRERCGTHAGIGFAAEHANSTRVLPDVFNGALRRSEMRAARALEGVVAGEKRKR